LTFGNPKGNCKVNVCGVVEAILYRLKTGCQWRYLPMKLFFRSKYSWKSVYYHFQKWSKDGSWELVWLIVLEKYRSSLDMSSIQLDGTHTPAKRGGEKVAYQGRKKSKTSNLLFLSDSQGIPIACSTPEAGNHNDGYKLNEKMEEMLTQLEMTSIPTDGLFLNADAGFDFTDFRTYCFKRGIHHNIAHNKRNNSDSEHLFDDLLYKDRFVIERTNAWMDAFKAILIRFETNNKHWKALNLLVMTTILLRRL
jgi:transposase